MWPSQAGPQDQRLAQCRQRQARAPEAPTTAAPAAGVVIPAPHRLAGPGRQAGGPVAVAEEEAQAILLLTAAVVEQVPEAASSS